MVFLLKIFEYSMEVENVGKLGVKMFYHCWNKWVNPYYFPLFFSYFIYYWFQVEPISSLKPPYFQASLYVLY